MPSTTVLTSIGILVASFVVGLLFMYVMNPDSKEGKRQQLDEVSSLLVNFIIYIWVGKIIVNFPKFIKDPLAILAYPSNSAAFYVASLFIVVNIVYIVMRKEKDLFLLLEPFVPLLLGASFLYEVLQVIVLRSRSNTLYLTLLMVLLISYLLLQGRFAKRHISLIVFIIWVIGQLVLSIIYSYATIFSYMITPIFYMILFIIITFLVLVRRKGQV